MSFFHPLFLIGLAGMLVPIILHLLNRRHAKLLDWGATQFLLGSLVSRRRRLLLEEMMLLAMRCLLCALAVLVIARPLLRNSQNFWSSAVWVSVLPLLLLGTVALAVGTAFWQERIWRWRLWAAGALMILGSLLLIVVRHKEDLANQVGGERDVAIVIDASTSMGLVVEGKSNFQRAVDEALQLVPHLGPDTTVSIVLAGAAPKVLTDRYLTQRDEIERVLRELKAPLGGSANIRRAVHKAWLALKDAPNTAKQIVVFTDRQRNSWQVDDLVRWEATAGDMKGDVAPPQIYARTFSLPTTLSNVTVTKVEPARRVVGTDRAVNIDVEIKNTGTNPVSAKNVELKVDGEIVDKRDFKRMEPGNTQTVSFSHRFAKPGARVIEVNADANDDLLDDNVRLAAVRVMDRLPVLIVNSGPEREFLLHSSAYAQLALAPGADESPGDGGTFPPLVQAKVVDPLHLSSRDLTEFRVIILADAPRVEDADARRLAEFVAAGGGLLVAPGVRANAEFYNRWLQADGQSPLLPAKLEERKTIAAEQKAVQFAPSTLSHPALRPFADAKGDEGTALFRSYWKLASRDGAPLQSGGNLTNSDPMLVEKQVGAGSVVLLATSLDLSGSNIANRRPAFPIFLHLLTYHLADIGRSALTFEAGQEPVLSLVGEKGSAAAFRVWKPKLRGEYFVAADFQKKPVERLDAKLDFDWQTAAPIAEIKPDKFAVRWTGSIVPDKTETIKLVLWGQGSAQLWWEDKPLISRAGPGSAEASVAVVANRRYRLRVEETKTTQLAGAKLEWESPSHARQIIPEGVLFHDEASSEGEGNENKYVLTGPANTKETATSKIVNGVLTINLPAVPAPGLYRLKPPTALVDELKTTQDDNKQIPVAMTTSAQEADLAAIADTDWTALAQVAGVEHAVGDNAIKSIADGKPIGKELWKYLAFTALVILIGEIALTRWIAMQRQATADPVTEFEFRARTGDAAYLQRFATPLGRPSPAGNRAKEAASV